MYLGTDAIYKNKFEEYTLQNTTVKTLILTM